MLVKLKIVIKNKVKKLGSDNFLTSMESPPPPPKESFEFYSILTMAGTVYFQNDKCDYTRIIELQKHLYCNFLICLKIVYMK